MVTDYLYGCPLCWSARRQSIRAVSTCESEYVAIYDTIMLSRSQGWLSWWLGENGAIPTVMVDNQSAIALSNSSVITKNSKHMSLRYHLVKDYCRDLAYCPTAFNKADALTKGGKLISLFKHDQHLKEEEEEEEDGTEGEVKVHFVSVENFNF